MAYIGSQPTKVVSQQSSKVYRYTATAGQTVFSGADVNNQVLNVTPSDVEVHMNGLLLDPTDYTVTSSSVTLGAAANAGDELTVTGMVTFEVADTYDKTTADARYVNAAGDTMTGALALPSAGLTVGTDQLAVDSSGRVTMPYQPHIFYTTLESSSQTSTYVIPRYTQSRSTRGSNGYNTSTGIYTAPVSGVYSCVWVYLYQNLTGSATIDDGFEVNGNYYYSGNRFNAGDYSFGDNYTAVQGAANVYLAANDTFSPKTQLSGAGTWNFYGGSTWGYLMISLIG